MPLLPTSPIVKRHRAGLGCCGHPRRARWPDIFIAIDIEYPRSSESERIIARRIVQHR
jgi:hypothetical protein